MPPSLPSIDDGRAALPPRARRRRRRPSGHRGRRRARGRRPRAAARDRPGRRDRPLPRPGAPRAPDAPPPRRAPPRRGGACAGAGRRTPWSSTRGWSTWAAPSRGATTARAGSTRARPSARRRWARAMPTWRATCSPCARSAGWTSSSWRSASSTAPGPVRARAARPARARRGVGRQLPQLRPRRRRRPRRGGRARARHGGDDLSRRRRRADDPARGGRRGRRRRRAPAPGDRVAGPGRRRASASRWPARWRPPSACATPAPRPSWAGRRASRPSAKASGPRSRADRSSPLNGVPRRSRPASMVALGLALGASIAWGGSDFLAGLVTRRLPVLTRAGSLRRLPAWCSCSSSSLWRARARRLPQAVADRRGRRPGRDGRLRRLLSQRWPSGR